MGNSCLKGNNSDYQMLSDRDESLRTINDNLVYYKKNCIKLKDYLKEFNNYNVIESKEYGLNPRQPAENYLLAGCYAIVSKRIEYDDKTIFTTMVENDEYVFYTIPYPFQYNSLNERYKSEI